MFKSICTAVVVVFVLIGALNFHALNRSTFKSLKVTVTTKPIGEIPGDVLSTVTSHRWKFVKKS
jgi:hypothetical protein